jgi:hypothetical protein
VVVETPVVETIDTSNVTMGYPGQPDLGAEQPVVQETANETPVQETANEPKAKKPKIRYMPAKELSTTSVILEVAPNPKQNRPGNHSYKLYELYYKDAVGKTVAQFEKAAQEIPGLQEKKGRARRLLRWDVAHGHVKIGEPVVETTEAAAAAE